MLWKKCKSSLFVRQKLLSESIRSVNDSFSTYGNTKIAHRIVYIFLFSPSAVGVFGARMERGGSREVSQQKQLFQQFNVVSSGCGRALPGIIWGLFRSTPECTQGTQSRGTAMPRQGVWAGCCPDGIWSVLLLGLPGGLWASSKEGICPLAFSSVLNIK